MMQSLTFPVGHRTRSRAVLSLPDMVNYRFYPIVPRLKSFEGSLRETFLKVSLKNII